jgi:hypothetical protein
MSVTNTQSLSGTTVTHINSSNTLDFSVQPHPNLRSNTTTISILPSCSTKHRTNEATKWMMITIASELGTAKMNKANKLKICKALMYLESYYLGYEAPVTMTNTFLK